MTEKKPARPVNYKGAFIVIAAVYVVMGVLRHFIGFDMWVIAVAAGLAVWAFEHIERRRFNAKNL